MIMMYLFRRVPEAGDSARTKYYYSSCVDYLGTRKGLLDVEFI